MRKFQWLSGFAFVALLAACSEAPLDLDPLAPAARAVPFEASVSGSILPDADGVTFELVGDEAIDLVAWGMGEIAYAAQGTLTEFSDDGVPTRDVLTETLTAANGDTLTIRCEQVLERIGPGVFRGTDTWAVVGGTGRFSGATGEGGGETFVDLAAGTFAKELTGSIAYRRGN